MVEPKELAIVVGHAHLTLKVLSYCSGPQSRSHFNESSCHDSIFSNYSVLLKYFDKKCIIAQ